ncbi:MAG: chemotaxis protein CheW [Bacteriovoracaceae bacterium]|nr:chemotaxis protein CheW [Bacteriovoracaceae bacterium]
MSSEAMTLVDSSNSGQTQYSTFLVAGRLYGIDVMSVQEVTMPMPLTNVPLSPPFVKGLINLRGQISTALDLRELLILPKDSPDGKMAVVCKHEDCLVSLLIDQICDVVGVSNESFERTPDTIDPDARRFFKGVHKLPENILTVIDVKSIFHSLNDKKGN